MIDGPPIRSAPSRVADVPLAFLNSALTVDGALMAEDQLLHWLDEERRTTVVNITPMPADFSSGRLDRLPGVIVGSTAEEVLARLPK